MAKDLNDCKFIGRIGNDINIKYLTNGNAVVSFSIACNDDYKKDGQKVERTNWIDLIAYGKTAEIIGEYCQKGSQIFVSGKQTKRKWQDKTGADRYSTEVIVENVQLLGGKGSGQGGQQHTQQADSHMQQSAKYGGFDDFGDDIPWE